jgi:catechol 2,3-dioxygenase-like lactoylglutathione lyase family enzyme
MRGPAFHHVSIVTDEPSRLAAFVREVLGMPSAYRFEVDRAEVAGLLGWPPATGSEPSEVRAELFGGGAAGLLEIVHSPTVGAAAPPVRGLVQVALQVPDIGRVLERARQLPADEIVEPRTITVAGHAVQVAAVVVAGVRFQLTGTPEMTR